MHPVGLRKYCGANFEDMKPIGDGARMCAHCSTPVHDLTEPSVALVTNAPGQRRCIRYLEDADGELVRGTLPPGAVVIPARMLLSKRRRERWLAIAAVASFPLLLEACGDESVPGSVDAGADAQADASRADARVGADAGIGSDAASDAPNDATNDAAND